MNRLFGLMGLFLVFLILPFLGSEAITLSDLGNVGTVGYRIFWELRIPRLIFTIGLGGVLAVLGSSYQTILKNPLCEPYILGISSAVILGIIVTEFLFLLPPSSYLSFVGGGIFAITLILFLVLFGASRFGTPDKLVLFGIGSNFILSSFIFIFLSLQSKSVGGGAMKWLFGFLPWLSLKSSLMFNLFCFLILFILWIFSRSLDAMTLGDSVARTLGASPKVLRSLFLLFSSIVLTIVVSLSGTVGFVGLVVPHFCRLVFRPANSRALLPLCFVIGALFLGLADALSRALFPPFEFPVGVVTTLLGGPLFLGVLWRRK